MEKKIYLVKGFGKASTKISAFDEALHDAGIMNMNLVYLSSVIPFGATIEYKGRYDLPIDVGQIQPVVMACISASTGDEISAGLGWCTAEEGGVFVEVHGRYGEKKCQEDVLTSVTELCERRDWHWTSKPKCITSSARVNSQPTSVLVSAVYSFIQIK